MRDFDNPIGSVKGILKAVPLRGRSEFRLCPPVGNPVRCSVPRRLREKVQSHLGSNVSAWGECRYLRGMVNPVRIKVWDMDVHPPDEELPSLIEMKGMLKEILSGRSSEEIIRGLRDD